MYGCVLWLVEAKKRWGSRLVTQNWAARAIQVQAGSECPSGAASVTLMRLHPTRDQWAGPGARRGWTIQPGAQPGAEAPGPAADRAHARTEERRLVVENAISFCLLFFLFFFWAGYA